MTYQDLKEMAFELADISNYINVSIDPYLLIEITLLKYFNKETNFTSRTNQNISREINEQENEIKETPKNVVNKNKEDTTKIISQEIISAKNSYEELIKIRVNNCFVNAKKEYLQKVKDMWQNLLKKIEDKSLLNLLIDCNVVTASDQIAVLTNVVDGTTNLINSRLNDIETLFNKEYNNLYKFIALTENEWNKEKQVYINNLKNKQVYHYIEEPKSEEVVTNNIDNIEKIAYDIFDKEKIEIE